MIKNYTVRRIFFSIGALFLYVQASSAQSVLNFPRASQDSKSATGIAVTNPNSIAVDVQFTYYGIDGNILTAGLLNPVSFRIGPKGQLAILSNEMFGGAPAQGWIQVTSVASGLQGAAFTGDFNNSLDGSNSATAMTLQVLPFLQDDGSRNTNILITNPGAQRATVSITFYNEKGAEAGTFNTDLSPHAQVRVIPSGVWARVSSGSPVVASAVLQSSDAVAVINGQPIESATKRVIPHFTSGSGVDGFVSLVNPTGSAVAAAVTLFSDTGELPLVANLVVPANGELNVDARVLSRLIVPPLLAGWLRIESASAALNAVAILDSGRSIAAIAGQSGGMGQLLFSRITDSDNLYTGLVLVNSSATPISAEIAFSGVAGAVVASRNISIGPDGKVINLISDLIPEAGRQSGIVSVRTSSSLFGMEIVGSPVGRFLTAVQPARLQSVFVASNGIVSRPTILTVEPGTQVHPGSEIRVSVQNFASDVAFMIERQVVPSRQISPVSSTFIVTIPNTEYGYTNLRIRSGGVESDPVLLRLTPDDGSLSQTVSGRAFYQKIDVTDNGLDLTHPYMAPIRHARVEVVSRSLQTLVSVSETDDRGQFQIAVPPDPDLTVRVVSQLRRPDLRVADNTNNNSLYVISRDVDMREQPATIVLADATRLSGAFNILELIQRGNELVRTADTTFSPAPVTVFWSTQNTNRTGSVKDGLVGTTYFSLTTNTAYVLGDRDTDSDEYDDSVIVHEYAHMLAVQFSRDDSPGGAHGIGDILDPRVAWSEGWANFFSGAARNDAIYRDSSGPNGNHILRYDMEDNTPPGDQAGYWSEASVQSLLWDLIDDHPDNGDSVQVPFASIWAAFTDLRNDRFVYLPYFLDHFIGRNPGSSELMRNMVLLRSIDFQPNVRPSVTNPFPRPIAASDSVTGEVDSLTQRRTNLMQSSHFFTFNTTGGMAAIRLDITGLGPGNNPNANDLDLLLLDPSGRVIERSDRGLNGQSELITTPLENGSYVIEVRSFYTRAGATTPVFNSGRYRLSLVIQ